MLLRETGDGVVAIPQPAHAWLSGLMARAWGNERFAEPYPRQDVCLAAGLHDIGWIDWELRPGFDPRTGWPRTFADVPAEEHTKLWSKGVEHVGAFSPYAAVLVSMHGDTIYDKTFDAATARPEAANAVRRFRADQALFRERALEAIRRDPAGGVEAGDAQLAFNKALLAAVDTLSLQICWGSPKVAIGEVPTGLGDVTLLSLEAIDPVTFTLDPWPFRHETLPLRLPGRILRQKATSQQDLDDALRHAPLSVLDIVLVPARSA